MPHEPWTPLRPEAILLLVAVAGCHGTPPGYLVGESQHFRLYVDPDATVPAGLDGLNGIAALETEWADVHTMLQMPDGKITYYWLSPDHSRAACGELEADAEACFWPQGLEVDASALPQPHELNHAYMYLREQRIPLPFLAEGMAEAIACEADFPLPIEEVPWEGAVVAYPPSQQPYAQGGAFVRYLIRTYGIAAFLRYYGQAPEQRDPAMFASNFQSFWGTTMDDAWASSNQLPPPGTWSGDSKICPCSLPTLDPTGAVTNDPARAPYWLLPQTAPQTLALTPMLGSGADIFVRDCAGVRPVLTGPNLLVRLDETVEPRYVLPPLGTATVDTYLAEDCGEAAPFSGPVVTMLFGGLIIAVPPSGPSTVYLNLASSFSGTLRAGLTETCGTCAFDQGSCHPLAVGATLEAQGPFLGRATFDTYLAVPTPDLMSTDIDILGQ
jgi:hypothetical protein